MLKENSRKVYDYVKANDGKNMTAADIAEATGLEVRSVNGIITSAFQKKELANQIFFMLHIINSPVVRCDCFT